MAAESIAVRVGRPAYEAARRMAKKRDHSITRVIEDAVSAYERQAFWEEVAEQAARLRADPERWAAYQADLRALEGTLMDGLDPQDDFRALWEAQRQGQSIEFTWGEPESVPPTRPVGNVGG